VPETSPFRPRPRRVPVDGGEPETMPIGIEAPEAAVGQAGGSDRV
jgi:hypothetical protein